MQVNRLLQRSSIVASAIVLSSLSLGAQSVSKANELRVEDPSGIVMTITAMLVVFFGLAVLYLCFKGIGKLSQHLSARNRRRENAPKKVVAPTQKNGMSPEVTVAIGMALYEAAGGMHDEESGVITITHTQGHAPSGWSNKAFNQRVALQLPEDNIIMKQTPTTPSPEVLAAIGLALTESLADYMHDTTDMRLTIRRPSVASAWALKSQVVRSVPSIKEH